MVNASESSRIEDNKQNSLGINNGDFSTEKSICHLCKSLVDKLSVISLTKFVKEDNMMEVFQGHLQEVVS